jgi:phospholipase C
MQENRSFDSYFGTYPGADGIAMRDGVPIACLPDLQRGSCVRPFHDPHDQDMGGPHGAKASDKAVDGGKMDGFIRVMLGAKSTGGCPTDIPTCVVHGHEHRVMAITTGASFPIIR